MKKRRHPRTKRKSETITGRWAFSGAVTLGTISGDTSLYYESNATSVTFPAGTFSGFAVGDVITITGGANDSTPVKKKKVHVARRRRKERPITHTITCK
jgi:hypothetical protein